MVIVICVCVCVCVWLCVGDISSLLVLPRHTAQAQTDVADDVDAEAAVATVMLQNEIAELTTRCHELSDENESLKRTVRVWAAMRCRYTRCGLTVGCV